MGDAELSKIIGKIRRSHGQRRKAWRRNLLGTPTHENSDDYAYSERDGERLVRVFTNRLVGLLGARRDFFLRPLIEIGEAVLRRGETRAEGSQSLLRVFGDGVLQQLLSFNDKIAQIG